MEFVRALRPDARLTIYTPDLPMSRVESFLENRAFSNPDAVAWTSLSVGARRDFIARGDRGVFGPERVAAFAYDERCHFAAGRVVHVARERGGPGVRVRLRRDERRRRQPARLRDQLHRLRPAGAAARAAGVRRAGRGRAPAPARSGTGRPIASSRSGGSWSWRACSRDCISPGLASLSQGPGFANLGSLGLLADRVLEPLFRAGGDAPPSTRAQRRASRPARVRASGA